jgi:hypothetical protein
MCFVGNSFFARIAAWEYLQSFLAGTLSPACIYASVYALYAAYSRLYQFPARIHLSRWMITVYEAVTGLNRAAGYNQTARRMGTHCDNRRGVLIFFWREHSHRLAYMPPFTHYTTHTAAYIISGADYLSRWMITVYETVTGRRGIATQRGAWVRIAAAGIFHSLNKA